MIIDCHGHYTRAPAQLDLWRKEQLSRFEREGTVPAMPAVSASDDEIRASIAPFQLRIQGERGVDLTLFSPRAAGMAHHQGDEPCNVRWAEQANEMIHRVCSLFPRAFAGVCQLPQTAGVQPGARVLAELERCVLQYGFVGVNLNPDASGGHWRDPPLWDRGWWYPLYEKMVELDVPAMIHVSDSCNSNFHTIGAHYLNADTTAFMQLLTSRLFQDFPTLRFVIPHGGGAVPYHWGRYRGIAQMLGLPTLAEGVLRNVFFDTCVYHQAGIDLLLNVVPEANILFGSEILGAAPGIDPETGHSFNDTRRYIEASPFATGSLLRKVFSENALRVYPRLGAHPAVREAHEPPTPEAAGGPGSSA